MKPPNPPRPWGPGESWETYWSSPPPARSARCQWWVDRIQAGWRPNMRMASCGYYEGAELYGVWIWEMLNVLMPLLRAVEQADHITKDEEKT